MVSAGCWKNCVKKILGKTLMQTRENPKLFSDQKTRENPNGYEKNYIFLYSRLWINKFFHRIMDLELAKLFINAVQTSLRRSRWVLSILVTLCLSIFIAAFNVYFSWLRGFALMNKWSSEAVTMSNQQKLVQDWIDSSFITMPVLGIKFHVADAGLLGSFIITIMFLFLYYSFRRENHVIAKALRLANNEPNMAIKKYIYNGVTSLQVFTTTTQNDRPIDSLQPAPSNENNIRRLPRALFSSLYFLPAATILTIFIGDILSMFVFHSPFRDGGNPIENSSLTPAENIHAVIILLVAAAAFVFCCFMAKLCRDYQNANAAVIHMLGRALPEEER